MSEFYSIHILIPTIGTSERYPLDQFLILIIVLLTIIM